MLSHFKSQWSGFYLLIVTPLSESEAFVLGIVIVSCSKKAIVKILLNLGNKESLYNLFICLCLYIFPAWLPLLGNCPIYNFVVLIMVYKSRLLGIKHLMQRLVWQLTTCEEFHRNNI